MSTPRRPVAGGLVLVVALVLSSILLVDRASAATASPTQGSTTALGHLDVADRQLSPRFTPAQPDYSIPCEPGTNDVTVEAVAVSGGAITVNGVPSGARASLIVRLRPDQLVHVEATHPGLGSAEYWIRCLPPDFPELIVEGASPNEGWYLTGSGWPGFDGAPYAIITDRAGVPVWYRRTESAPGDLKLLEDGVLAWSSFQGPFGTDPLGNYQLRRLDGELVDLVRAVGVPTDNHDLRKLPNGNYVVMAYVERPGPIDFTGLDPSFERPDRVLDGYIQEVAPTGELVWEWRAHDHFGFSEALHSASDPHHLNAVEVTPDGDLIVSARNLDAVFRVDRPSGRVEWKLGGAPPADPTIPHLRILDDPLDGPRAQHDARLIGPNRLTIYDNQTAGRGPARAAEYVIDPAVGTARLVWEYRQPEGQSATFTGSTRRQADGSTVIAWGGVTTPVLPEGFFPWLTEVGPGGRARFEIAGPGPIYRFVREPAGSFDRDELRALASSELPPNPSPAAPDPAAP